MNTKVTLPQEILPFDDVAQVEQLVSEHATWRSQCLNLIASENLPGAWTRKFLTCDFLGRYPSYRDDPSVAGRSYKGNRFIAEIEIRTRALGERLFGADFIDFRPLGGQSAVSGLLCGLMQPGDLVLETDKYDGGHCAAAHFVVGKLLQSVIRVGALSYNERRDLDLDLMRERILKEKPRLIIYGTSLPVFPESTKALREAAEKVGAYVAYDASHVVGFLAAGLWPNPLDEGCDIVAGSIHKTFPGPGGGLVYTRREDLFRAVRPGFMAMIGNYHPERIPAVAAALLEMREHGTGWMRQTIRNAQAFGRALYDRGIHALNPERNFSQTHQVLVDVSRSGDGKEIENRLEAANIIGGATQLPQDRNGDGQARSGLRLGVQELTRIGMTEGHMAQVAEFLKMVIVDRRHPERVAGEVAEFAGQFKEIRYSLKPGMQAYQTLVR